MRSARYILSLIILLATAPGVYAQGPLGKHSLSAGMGVSIPTGSNQFIDNGVGLAPTIAYEFRFCPMFSLGMAVDYIHAKKSGEMRVRYGDDLVDGYAKKEFNAVPIRAQIRWYPLGAKECRLQPYVTVGAGVQYAKYNLTGDQLVTSERKNWSGVITPDAGLRYFPCAGKFFLDARLSWQWGGNAWKEVDNNKNQQAFRVHIGAGVAF